MSRNEEFHSGGHDNWCIEMAETVVRVRLSTDVRPWAP